MADIVQCNNIFCGFNSVSYHKCVIVLIYITWFLDLGEIWSRLFNHRPFLNGEINYFLKEFEQNRSDHEIGNLFSALMKITDISDTHIPRAIVNAETNLPQLENSVEEALEVFEGIIDTAHSEKLHSTLEQKRAERKVQWKDFVDDMSHKCSRVDITFEEKEEELREFYSDLERKLHIH